MPQYTVPVTPKELGFSGEDYPYWREHQAAAIERILNSPAKLIIVSAHTGSGKSPIALGCARVLFKDGKRTTIVTSSKELQRQYLDYTFPTDEYDDGQPITATGRSNHPCIRADAELGTTAANGICVEGKPCEYMGDRETGLKAECPWYAQRDNAEAAYIRVLNYPFFILMASYQGFFKKNALLVCDEGHKVDKEILRAAVAELDHYDLKLIIDWGGYRPRIFEPLLTRNPQVSLWADEMVEMMDRHKTASGGRITGHARRVRDTLARIAHLKDKMVVIDDRDGGLKFAPVLPEEFAGPFLLDHADKVVLMSATIFGKAYWASRFGLPIEDVEFIEIPSTFPTENRKVYYMPVLQMNNRIWQNQDEIETKLVGGIDNLIARNLPNNGLIHTANKKLAEFIKARSNFAPIMLVGGGKFDLALMNSAS